MQVGGMDVDMALNRTYSCHLNESTPTMSSPMDSATTKNTVPMPVYRSAKDQWALPVAILVGDRLLPLRGI